MPRFPREKIIEIDNTLEYPGQGSKREPDSDDPVDEASLTGRLRRARNEQELFRSKGKLYLSKRLTAGALTSILPIRTIVTHSSFKALSKQRPTATFPLIPAAGYPRIGPKSNIQPFQLQLESRKYGGQPSKADEALKSISTPDEMDSSLGTLEAADAARLHGPVRGRGSSRIQRHPPQEPRDGVT